MDFNTQDLAKLEKYFDEIYVKKDTCDEVQRKTGEKFSKWDKRTEILSHDFDVIKKILWVITSAAIGTLVATIFNLILK